MNVNKVIQALTFWAYNHPCHRIDKMKAFKLMWLADRYHVRQYGRMISEDSYYAMTFGMVPSGAKDILEGKICCNDNDVVNEYIEVVNHQDFIAKKAPNMAEFSDSDEDAMRKVLHQYNNMSAFELSELSHKFPEWLAYKSRLDDPNAKNSYRVDMDYFFEDAPLEENGGLFQDSKELLELTKDLYHQNNRL